MDNQPNDDNIQSVRGVMAAVSVARDADAWLAQPEDTEAYSRLCRSVAAWRAWRNPTLGDTGTAALAGGEGVSPQLLSETMREVFSGLRRDRTQ